MTFNKKNYFFKKIETPGSFIMDFLVSLLSVDFGILKAPSWTKLMSLRTHQNQN